jgi:hypothetical protein
MQKDKNYEENTMDESMLDSDMTEEEFLEYWSDEPEDDLLFKFLERKFEEKKYKDFYVTIRTKDLDVRRAPVKDIDHL